MEDKKDKLKSYFSSETLKSLIELDGLTLSVEEFIDNILSKSPEFNSPEASIEYLVENIKNMLDIKDVPLGEIPLEDEAQVIVDDIPFAEDIQKQSRLADIIKLHPEWNEVNITDNGTGKKISFKQYLLTRNIDEYDDNFYIRFGPRYIELTELYEKMKTQVDNNSLRISIEDKRELVQDAYIKALAPFLNERELITGYILANGETLDDYIHGLINHIDDNFELNIEELGYDSDLGYDPKNITDTIIRLVSFARKKALEARELETTHEILTINKAYDKVGDVQEISITPPKLDDKNDLTEEEKKSLTYALPEVLVTSVEEDLLDELFQIKRAISKNRGDSSLERDFLKIQERINKEASSESPFYNRMMSLLGEVYDMIEKAKNIHKGQENAAEETFEYYKNKATIIFNKIDETKTKEEYSRRKYEIKELNDEISKFGITNPNVRELITDLNKALEGKRFSVNARSEAEKTKIKSEIEALIHSIRFGADNPDNRDLLDFNIQKLIELIDNNQDILTPGEVDMYYTIIENARSTMERSRGMRAVL